MDRKKFFNKGILDIAKKMWNTPVGQSIDRRMQGMANLLDPTPLADYLPDQSRNANDLFVRPPGALENKKFKKNCTQCGDCIAACPHHSISQYLDEGPVLNPNQIACHLCKDFPCIEACKDGALLPLRDGVFPQFGFVRFEEKSCLNYETQSTNESLNCGQCAEICPIEGVIVQNETDDLPEFNEGCTGCGLCVEVCPALPKALQIKPQKEASENEKKAG